MLTFRAIGDRGILDRVVSALFPSSGATVNQIVQTVRPGYPTGGAVNL